MSKYRKALVAGAAALGLTVAAAAGAAVSWEAVGTSWLAFLGVFGIANAP